MARDPRDEIVFRHREWLGYLQPVGLVVSPPAMADGDCILEVHSPEAYLKFLGVVSPAFLSDRDGESSVLSIRRLLMEVCEWRDGDLIPADDPRAAGLVVALPDYRETLRPTFAVPVDAKAAEVRFGMLVLELAPGTRLDALPEDPRGWHATPQARFERLLRETEVPTGLLSNGIEVRLVYSPRGESPGHLTFPVALMASSPGRLAFAALRMLLGASRVFATTGGKPLSHILAESRRYQNTVSTALAGQVLASLYELLRGFQAADAHRKGELLGEVLAADPDHVAAGQLTVLLRLVFVLYAEDRGLMSADELYVRNYSVIGLFDKLRGDAGRHPDTMDQRYGAWARLVTLFRMVHDGARAGTLRLPARNGYLFDPDRYPFLEGRAFGSEREKGERLDIPLVSDGVVFRVLSNLLILDGERLSYRALDVEQIGSVYEAMMGFRVEVATGRSIAIKPVKAHGAPVTIDLDALLAQAGDKRGKWFKDRADRTLTAREAAALKVAKTPDEAAEVLAGKVAKAVTPSIVPAGSMVLQPSDERRRSGSHYTPRTLTKPIVEKALEPILRQLGDQPTPEQLLELKVCDPAMGSGAFLVEVCRQLGERLAKSWHHHHRLPTPLPPDEDELLHAQRLVAQRCVYGVDKNPMAVSLAKLSLWLTTLAREHPFTFVDHSLRCGDSLVGLTRKQIVGFHWKDQPQRALNQYLVEHRIDSALRMRQSILDADECITPLVKSERLRAADDALETVRFAGNLAVAAFFRESSDKNREARRTEYLARMTDALTTGDMTKYPLAEESVLWAGDKPVAPFHWEIEYPEVFARAEAGFDCVVGNPPFAGKNTIGDGHRDGYLDWLKAIHAESHGNADLVAHFFRRSFDLLRSGGTLGLIATNTIAQGDTRSTGLRWICGHGGTIYTARRRYKWPGLAAVVVSVVHISKGAVDGPYELDGRRVERVTAYLFHAGGSDDPSPLQTNSNISYKGCDISGMGFTFDDTPSNECAGTVSLMESLINENANNQEVIFPFIGGEELNGDPRQWFRRYVINFGERSRSEAMKWKELYNLVEEKVRPGRLLLNDSQESTRLKEKWWLFRRSRPDLEKIKKIRQRLLAVSEVTPNLTFAFVPTAWVGAHSLKFFDLGSYSAFSLIQSRPHECWARFFGSSMKDDLRYSSSDCFETFPFPVGFETNEDLEAVGKEYYEFRAALMVRKNEGLTKTYNRFHDKHETDAEILKLRGLHDRMDRAVLKAYGPPFSDLVVPPCEFILDYEEEDEEEDAPGRRARRKPYRFRWPDAFRDEVLALLLELNRQRAEAEARAALAAVPVRKPRARRGAGGEGMFEGEGG